MITFITTGGTIDKNYASAAGTYNFEIGEPVIEDVLEKITPGFPYKIIPILRKDSLDMNDDDRQLVYKTCNGIENEKIIITHGTDTMIYTAMALSGLENKTIVLTGSSKPQIFRDTDAEVNIGVAVGAIYHLQNGVYVAMNGIVHPWDGCEKEPKTGQFIKR